MRGWLTPERRDEPELMDAPGLPPVEVEDAYRILRRVNRQFFGNRRSLSAELSRFLSEESLGAGDALTLLDVGSGSGDLPALAREELGLRGFSTRAVALDLDRTALALARREGLEALRADALRLPFADRSFDLVSAAKFAHHFSGPDLARLVAEMARVASRRVVLLDIRRHWLAYAGFVAWSRVFTRNRLVRYDGPLSVLRGFTREELLAVTEPLGEFSWAVRPYVGFQLTLVGCRLRGEISPDAGGFKGS